MEQAKGTADMQAELAKSKVGIEIKSNNSNARKAEGDGEAYYIRETGSARGAEVEAVGLARAKGFEAQVRALGANATVLVNSINALAEKNIRFVPEVLVNSGNASGAVEGLAAAAMRLLGSQKPANPEGKA